MTVKEYQNIIDSVGNDQTVLNVNGHLHTPYSFSSFNNIEQIFKMADDENIDVIGINDFFTVDGYPEFHRLSKTYKKYPLFNIEFIGLVENFQQNNIRVNDPSNPGRIYFSGKGLRYPFSVNTDNQHFINQLIKNSQLQVQQMTEKANNLLKQLDASIGIDYGTVKKQFAKNLVRERHIAKAIKHAIFQAFTDEKSRVLAFTQLFGNKALKSSVNDEASLENEIRSNLLKSGGSAFVPETKDAFPALDEIIHFILAAQGIPCYPVLLDHGQGQFTDFENDWEKMHLFLKSKNVHCIELIPSRNTIKILTEFVEFFQNKGYLILLGSEHNTPGIFPLTVKIEGQNNLSEYLKKISYNSSCVVAAHQFLVSEGKEGYINQSGSAKANHFYDFVKLGNAIIKKNIQ